MSKTQLDITKTVCMYLNSLVNFKTQSRHTLRSYSLDLSQAFKLDHFGYVKVTNGQVEFCVDESLTKQASKTELLSPHQMMSETDILPFINPQLNKWGKLSLASRNRKIAALKSFFKWCFQNEIFESDLSLNLTCPKVPKRTPHFLSVDEAISLLNHLKEELKKHPEHLSEVTLVTLLYGGGLRVSEACQLRWRDISLSSNRIKVLGKGSKERIVILPPMVTSLLNQLDKSKEFVWGAKPLHTSNAYLIVRKHGARAGLLKPLHPHALRHSFATHLLASGANLRTLQAILGHSSLTATEKYTHLSLNELARTLQKHHPIEKK